MMLDHIQDKLQMSREHLDQYRRKGLDMPNKGEAKADDMKILSTGDVHLTASNQHPQPQSLPQQQSGGVLKTLAILAAGALIPGAGIGGYLASQWLNQKPVATGTEDKSLDLGLLKFEDLKEQEPQQ